jgi:hypothetical protein
MANKIYLDLEHGSGQFYKWCKEKTDKSKEYTKTDGSIQHREYHNDLIGSLNSFSIADAKFGGEELRFSIFNKKDNTSYYFNFPLENIKKDFSDEIISIIKQLGSLEKGKTYRVKFYRIEKEDSKKVIKGISFAGTTAEDPYGENVVWEKVSKIEGTDIPKWEKVKKGRKEEWDRSKSELFLDEILRREVDRLAWSNEQAPVESAEDDDDDDSPF